MPVSTSSPKTKAGRKGGYLLRLQMTFYLKNHIASPKIEIRSLSLLQYEDMRVKNDAYLDCDDHINVIIRWPIIRISFLYMQNFYFARLVEKLGTEQG